MALTVLDLFSGIGGFSLGLERTGGFKTVAFCEIEPYCRAVLRKHWPDVPIFEDVTTLRGDDVGSVDVICGGFPCQDISVAGKQAGIDGERSGLWSEYARLIGEIQPRYAIVENVAAMLHNGLSRVLGDLASIGYDAEWHCIPASAVGAPHRRDRVWIVAHAQSQRRRETGRDSQRSQKRPASRSEALADASRFGPEEPTQSRPNDSQEAGQGQAFGGRGGEDLFDANGQGLPNGGQAGQPQSQSQAVWRMALAGSQRRGCAWWATEPDVGRVAHGVPRRVDRLRSLGNAVVPQVVEVIGNAILQKDNPAP